MDIKFRTWPGTPFDLKQNYLPNIKPKSPVGILGQGYRMKTKSTYIFTLKREAQKFRTLLCTHDQSTMFCPSFCKKGGKSKRPKREKSECSQRCLFLCSRCIA